MRVVNPMELDTNEIRRPSSLASARGRENMLPEQCGFCIRHTLLVLELHPGRPPGWRTIAMLENINCAFEVESILRRIRPPESLYPFLWGA